MNPVLTQQIFRNSLSRFSGWNIVQSVKQGDVSMNEPIVILNEGDLRANAVVILRRINQAEQGGLLFLLNPVLALDEAGAILSPAMKRHIRMGLRYGADDKKRIKTLEAEIGEIAGRAINPASDADVSDLLFNRLALKKPSVPKTNITVSTRGKVSQIYEPVDREPLNIPQAAPKDAETRRRTSRSLKRGKIWMTGHPEPLSAASDTMALHTDLLLKIVKRHPVVPKLIEVRALYEKGWQFMNREHYNRVRDGATVSLVRSVRFKTKSDKPATRAPVRRAPSTRIGKTLTTSAAMKRAAEPLWQALEKRSIDRAKKGV